MSQPAASIASPPAAKELGSLSRMFHRLRHQGLAASTRVSYQIFFSILNPGARRPTLDEVTELGRRFEDLLERDLDNVEQGFYPEELLNEFPLFDYLTKIPAAAFDMPRVLWRSRTGHYDDLPEDVDRDAYPKYYLRNFHWQTDGWLSERSADIYDASVEFLFGGTADVMRRQAIPAIVQSCRESGTPRPRVLDVGCGTGRFLSRLLKCIPGAQGYGVDLSPYYLKEARSNLADYPEANLVRENAEEMMFADDTFDAVSSVFMFHELPPRVRRRVFSEMARVAKPGAAVVVCDSAQLAESGELKNVLLGFPESYHEPYYKGYLKDDLAGIAEEAGLVVEGVIPCLVSKVVVARKPE